MKIAWHVMGHTGEYSDRNDWTVATFESISKAKDLMAKLVDLSTRLGVNMNTIKRIFDGKKREAAMESMLALDTNYNCDYTGVDYSVWFSFLYEEGENYLPPGPEDYKRARGIMYTAGL